MAPKTSVASSSNSPIQLNSIKRRNSNTSDDSSRPSSSVASIETEMEQQQQMRLGLEEPSPLRCFLSALTRTKPLDCRTDTNLNRCLNLVDLTALGVGTTLGLGLYVLAGQVASTKAGPAVVVSFGFAALASAFSALCYAEFAGRVPRAGSAYAYSYITVGEFVAFIIGWNLVLEYVIGASSVARGFSGYLCFIYNHVASILSAPNGNSNQNNLGNQTTEFNQLISNNVSLPSESTIRPIAATVLGSNTTSNILSGVAPTWTEPIVDYLHQYFDYPSVVIIIVMTIFMLSGVKSSTNITIAFTLLNITVVGVTVISSINSLDLHNWRLSKSEVPNGFGEGGFLPYGWSGVMAGSATCFFGFIGFDTIASSAEEAKNPKRNVPLSILLSLFISFLAYMTVAIVQTLLWPYYDQNKVTILPYIFGRLDMPLTYWVVLLGAIAGLASSQLAGMYPLPRILYSMSNDKLIYGYMSHIDRRLKLPVRATIIGSIFVALLACLLDIQDLADMVSIGTLAAYSLVSLSVLILRYGDRREAVDDSTINNNQLTFTDIISTIEQSGCAEMQQPFAAIGERTNGRIQTMETISEGQHAKVMTKTSIKSTDMQNHKKLGPKPSTPIREKGSKPLVPQLSVGFQSWFKSPSMQDSEIVLSPSGDNDRQTGEPQYDKVRKTKTNRSLLDLLITWKADDPLKPRQPDDETSRQSKILISILVVLTTVLDLIAVSLTNMASDPVLESSTSLTQSSTTTPTVAHQQNFPIDPKILLASSGCIAVVALAAVMLMLSRLPVSNSMPSDMFKVPWVPLIPTLSILVNTFLMLNLSFLTWVRFTVWMAIGLFIYFTYGIWNSEGYLFYLGR